MSETATILFTDLVSSTELRTRLGEDVADTLQQVHDRMLAEVVTDAGGEVIKGTGDGILAVFSGAADAVAAGVAAQQAAHAHSQSRPDLAFELRVGVSVGDVAREGGDVFGSAVIEAARICDTAVAGQVLVADLVRALARGRGGFDFESVGALELKGLPEPVPACQVRWEALAGPVDAEVPFPSLLAPTAFAPYVGRTEVLDDLGAAGEVALAGRTRLDLLVGEPGLGKTRTAAELAFRAHAAGAVVLYGRCDEELALPYQPFVEALDQQVQHVSDLERLGRFAGDLVRLVPDLADRVDGLPSAISSDARAEEHRLFEAVAAWLAAASRDAGLVLVVDDLHWATKPTLQMLLHVLRSLDADPDARVWLIGTYRDTDVDRAHPLQSALADLRRLESVRRTALDLLTSDDVVTFAEWAAGHDLDGAALALIRRAHAETDGNPFFVAEVIRHFVESGVVRLVDGRWIVDDDTVVDVPEGVRDVVGRRLDRLSGGANAVLTTGAVIGRSFGLDLLVDLLDESEDQILDVLDEALRARLVEETGAGEFRFAHALTRTVLAEELSATRLRRLHDRITTTLERLRPDASALLAHHAVLAGPTGGDLARPVRHCLAAGEDALQRRAHADAEVRFGQALELLEDVDGHVHERLQARCGIAEAQRNQGVPDYRAALYSVARDALTVDDVELAVRAVLATYRGLPSMVGDVDEEAVELLSTLLDRVGDEQTARRALLGAHLAGERVYVPGSLESRAAGYEAAVAIADGLDDPWVAAAVRARGVFAIQVPGRARDVETAGAEAIELADQTDDPSLRVLARAARAFGLLAMGQFREAERCLRDGLAIATDIGTPFDVWLISAGLVQFIVYDGDMEAAAAENQRVFEFGQAIGQQDAANWWGGVWTAMEFFRSESDAPVALGMSLAEQFPGSAQEWYASSAFVLAELGRTDEARDLIVQGGLGDPASAIEPSPVVGAAYGNLVGVAFRLGDVGLARRMIDVLRAIPGESLQYLLFVNGAVDGCLGLALSVVGEHDEAVTLTRRALAHFEDERITSHATWWRGLLAEVLARRGGDRDLVEARGLATRSARELDSIGAPARGDRIRAAIEAGDYGT